MQYDEGQLWISTLNTIKCYRVRYNGTVTEDRRKRLQLNEDDVSRFVVKNNKAVSGCRCAYIFRLLENFTVINLKFKQKPNHIVICPKVENGMDNTVVPGHEKTLSLVLKS